MARLQIRQQSRPVSLPQLIENAAVVSFGGLGPFVIERRCQKPLNRPGKRSRHELDVIPFRERISFDVRQKPVIGASKPLSTGSGNCPLLTAIAEVITRPPMAIPKTVQIF